MVGGVGREEQSEMRGESRRRRIKMFVEFCGGVWPEIGSAHKACHGLFVAPLILSSKAMTTMWPLPVLKYS